MPYIVALHFALSSKYYYKNKFPNLQNFYIDNMTLYKRVEVRLTKITQAENLNAPIVFTYLKKRNDIMSFRFFKTSAISLFNFRYAL